MSGNGSEQGQECGTMGDIVWLQQPATIHHNLQWMGSSHLIQHLNAISQSFFIQTYSCKINLCTFKTYTESKEFSTIIQSYWNTWKLFYFCNFEQHITIDKYLWHNSLLHFFPGSHSHWPLTTLALDSQVNKTSGMYFLPSTTKNNWLLELTWKTYIKFLHSSKYLSYIL